MRYIGGKKNLISEIEALVSEKAGNHDQVFVDLFSGTGVVANHFKSKYQVIANDMLYCSYILLKGSVALNSYPDFKGLKALDIVNPISFLNKIKPVTEGFITRHYSPSKNGLGRMYVTTENAMLIDAIRIQIEDWNVSGDVSEGEYFYLLSTLIEAVPFISNITGTFGAYLKHWDKRALKPLTLVSPILTDNMKHNTAYNRDANSLVNEVDSDITYIDPPYNSRQYTSNYHFLETIARYDNPEIKGVTGIRKYADDEKSKYCSKRYVKEQFSTLFRDLKTKHVVVSYSSDGLLNKDEMMELLKEHCAPESVECIEISYRRYKSKIVKTQGVIEYLFYAAKKKEMLGMTKKAVQRLIPPKITKLPNSEGELLASPLNYIGGKYKLLPQILPLFPKNIDNFVDLFCGGLNVGANVDANTVYANDINYRVIEVLELIKNTPIDDLLILIHEQIDLYELTSQNKDGFLNLRKDYNENPSPIKLYVLVCYSFNYQFRFNNSLKFNNPFGKDRSRFSERLKEKLIRFNRRISDQNIIFSSLLFEDLIDGIGLGKNDLVYCDPPYLITTGSYNDGNRGFKDWACEQEVALYSILDDLDKRGVKFALSNVLEHKGVKNESLIEWSKKYQVHDLNFNYKNSSYNTNRQDSKEVLIVNY
jgi:adenine-specific DNA-methyltransferase